MLKCVFCFFRLCTFVDVKAFHDLTVFSDTLTPRCKLFLVSNSKISISLKIEDMILNPGQTNK